MAAVTWVYRFLTIKLEFDSQNSSNFALKVNAFVVHKVYPQKIVLKMCNMDPMLLKIN